MKQIIIILTSIALSAISLCANAQNENTNTYSNSPKEAYNQLIIQQHNVNVELEECRNNVNSLTKNKARKANEHIQKLELQQKSILLQLTMFPKEFSDPNANDDKIKLQNEEFLNLLQQKVIQLDDNGQPNNNNNTINAGQFYTVLFAIAQTQIKPVNLPQGNVFIKNIANNKIAHFVGKFNDKDSADKLKNQILNNTTFKDAIVVLIK